MTARVSNKFGYAALSAYAALLVAAVVVAVLFGDRILAGGSIRPSPDLLELRTGSVRVYDESRRNCTSYTFDNVTGNLGGTGQPCTDGPTMSAAPPPAGRDNASALRSIQRSLRGY